uniref:AAA_12 domain-containing protein n=1 Tax=Ganoderma boninense TaxID=34458 RepID=A0A5K1K5Y0_9APHY|nr:AAA_12 domain-containing protein [Ganoderma boninense]
MHTATMISAGASAGTAIKREPVTKLKTVSEREPIIKRKPISDDEPAPTQSRARSSTMTTPSASKPHPAIKSGTTSVSSSAGAGPSTVLNAKLPAPLRRKASKSKVTGPAKTPRRADKRGKRVARPGTEEVLEISDSAESED